MRSPVSWLVTPRSLILVSFFFAQFVFAAPNSLTFQAKIVKPNQVNLEEPSVYFKFQYTDAQGLCVVYEEEFSSVDMTGSKGLVSLELGAGVKTYPPAAITMYDVFNFGTALSCQGGTPTAAVTPTAVERRKVIVKFNDGSGMQTLPIMNLNAVPFALHSTMANNSNQLGGLAASQFAKYSDITAAGCVAGQALRYTGVAFVCENVTGAGVATVTATAPILSSGGANPNISIPKATGAASGYLGSSDWSVFNNKLSNFSTMTSADVTTALTYTPLNRASNLSDLVSSSTARTNLGLGTAATLNVAASGDATATEVVKGNDSRLTGALQTSSSLSGDVTGTINATVVATVGGVSAAGIATGANLANNSTSANTASAIVRRNASGDFTAGVINATTFSGTNSSATNVSTQNIYLYDSGNINRILFKAPAAGITNYTLTLPPTVGTNGQVLSTNASGDLSWANATGGSVTTVTATAPLVSSGGASPDISLAKASGTVDGYLASSDWSIFNSKLSNFSTMTSLDVTTALTFIPLNRASNLSDLTNATTARTNLGLGTAAVLNGASSGDATAAELVKGNDTRLTDARAPSGAASGDLTGAYPNPTLTTTGVAAGSYSSVTVDAKGRVLAGVASLDLTTSVSGALPIANGGTGQTTTTTAFNALSPLSNKGDLVTRDGTNNIRLPVGVDGLVLKTNSATASGLEWAAASAGTVGTVTATAPLVSSGGASPDISLARSTAAADGYLASSDWSIFNSKLSNFSTMTSLDVTTALTFIPLNRASNLSDLTNATTARTNLGLGTAAVLNGASSGDATAAELVKGNDARLTDARVPSGAASGDLTGTYPNPTLTTTGVVASSDYTKVTVDAKGRVTSAGRLTSSDLTALYGYTPADSDSAWALNGSGDVSRATGKVGIGTSAPSFPLQVSGDISISGNYKINGVNIGSGTVGSVTAAATAGNPITVSGSTTSPSIDITRATASVNGYLASSDWSIFNSKIGTTAVFSGDVTGTYDATVLANSGVTAGSYSRVTVDSKGRVITGVASLDLTNSVSGVLPIANGGTNASAFTNTYGVGYFDGTRLVTSPAGAANQMLVQTVAGPIWTTATYPSVTTANQLLYSSANNTVAGLATAANSILTTNASGDPSWSVLSGDVYSQYALLAGRAGGQTLNGGTLSSQDLILDSTSHATKGDIILNPTGGNVGIGTATPTAILDILGSAASSGSAVNAINAIGGAGAATNGNGGGFSFTGGVSSGAGTGGNFSVTAGNGSTTGYGGAITLTGGKQNGNAESSAVFTIAGGSGGTGSAISLVAGGAASGGFIGGSLNFTGGIGGPGGSPGGPVNITGGAGGGATASSNGANVIINGGARASTATDGNVILANLRGNVGIGTAAPAYPLQVSGDVSISGNYKVNGVNIGSGTVTSVTAGSTAGNPITVSSSTTSPSIDITRATASVNGYLASSDFTTFTTAANAAWTLNGSGDVSRATGNVGIGNSSPGYTLTMDTTGANSNILYQNSASGGSSYYMQSIGGGSGLTSQVAGAGWTQIGDYAQSFEMNASGFDGSAFRSIASIAIQTEGGIAANNMPGSILFNTNSGASSGERMRINSAGNVGIGTTTPGYALQVSGDVSISGNYKVNGVNIGSGTISSVMAATTTGNPITVSSSTTSPSIDITRATASVNGYLASSDFSTFNNKLSSVLNSASIFVGNGSNVATAQVLSGDATLDNAGILTLANNSVTGTKILNGTITSADLTSSVANALWTVNGSGDVSRSTGNVGIGTAAPGSRLDVQAFGSGSAIRILNSGGNARGDFSISAGGHGRFVIKDGGGIDRVDLNAGSNNSIILSNSGGNPYVQLSSSGTDSYILGNVGIGTTTPGYALQVSGDVSISGNYKVNGVNIGSGTVTGVTAAATAGNPITVSSSTTSPSIDITRATASVNGYLASSDFTTFNAKLSSALTSANMFVGNGSNVATAVTMSGDATMVNTGVVTLVNSGVSAGSYSRVTVDAKGRVTTGVVSLDLTTSVSGVLPIANGGTNASSFANSYGVGYFDGTRLVTSPAGSANQLMVQTASGPVWTTATFPSTTTANQLLYSSAGNTVSGLATANSSVLTTNSSGVPSFTALSGDTFAQYALLAGRAAGQNLRGGTAASENLTLESTSNATKGYVILQPTGGNVGIGTTTPTNKLEVAGTTYSVNYTSQQTGLRVNSGTAGYGSVSVHSPGGDSGRIAFANGQSNWAWDTYLARTAANELTLSSDAGTGAAALNVRGSTYLATTSGYVGIGTTAPGYVLQVSGDISISGNYKVNGVNIGSGTVTGVTAAATAGNPITVSSSTTAPSIDITRATASVNGYLASSDFTTFTAKLTSALNSASIFVGNGSNIATAQVLSGDATLTNAGILTLVANSVTGAKILDGTITSVDLTSSVADALWTLNVSGDVSRTSGNVGIGTAAPRATLDVNGPIISKASVANASSTIDFLGGNIQHTTANCGSFIFHNLKDGGTYMFIVKGTVSTTCSFTAFSDAGTTALTVHLPPDHTATTTAKHTIYNVAVSGGDVYLAWTPGY